MITGSFAREEPKSTIEKKSGPKKAKMMKKEAREAQDTQEPEEMVRTVNLQEWDPETLPEHFFMTLEGKRRTGKSTFAKWMLQWFADTFSLVWCMTLTKASGYWQEFVGEQFTFDNWNPMAVLKLIERGDHFVKQYGEDSEQAKKLGSALIILDDVISAKIHDDMIFNRLATEGRHHLISVILMTQDPHAISPKVRDNTDVAVVFNLKTFRNKESIWRDFMNDIDKDSAMALLGKHAINHDALVCVQTNLDGKVEKNFFKSTGDKTKLEMPDYALGSDFQKHIVLEERKTKERRRKQLESQPPQEMRREDTDNYTIEKILR